MIRPGLLYAGCVLCSSVVGAMRVAVTGTTGRLGREVIQLLSSRGISTQCLLRHPIDSSVTPSAEKDATSSEVAAYLASLPCVTMVEGDATNREDCIKLINGCDAVLAVHGPPKPPPLQSILRLLPEEDIKHSRSINYAAVQNLIDAAKESTTCKRIVRITGKGEDPFGFFSILINMLGNIAKGWNYEGEQLLRSSNIDYTIIRPGILTNDDTNAGKVLALVDNGQDLPVSSVSVSQIAELCVMCLDYSNAARTTLTAMNVEHGRGEESYIPLLDKVTLDRRYFPATLIEEHKRGARIGSAILVSLMTVLVNLVIALLRSIGSL